MATGMVLSVAQTLFAALQSHELKEFFSKFGYKSELEKLQRTATSIKAVLLDADSKQEHLSHEARDFIDKLKDAFYDVDDLLDEYNTIIQRKNLEHQRSVGTFNKMSKKVRRFFSRSNHLIDSFNMSLELKNIQKKLDAIASDHANYGFTINYEPIKRTREDTGSYVYDASIIGREADKEAVLGLLLQDSNIEDQEVSFVREQIEGQRYLLVLDDVWSESREDWVDLKHFLLTGGRGSRILITTRSKLVGTTMGDYPLYDLLGLSHENSWRLFAQMAFQNGEEPADADLVEIGKEIVQRCANVPLSIRVIGSLLYGQGNSRWQSFKEGNLLKIKPSPSHFKEDGKNETMAILKLSYNHLSPSLKSCFSLCALFPKDSVLCKDKLISLWSAHGYIIDPQCGQGIEDVGEEYFCILLNRCFFQEIEMDDGGEIYECKMHDLMHDLAVEVAGNDLSTSLSSSNLSRNLRHVSIPEARPDGFNLTECLAQVKTTRTLLHTHTQKFQRVPKLFCQSTIPLIFSKCRCLRVLDLRSSLDKSLPSAIGELIHLRYLDLSENKGLEVLPESITKLHNLQWLSLTACISLKMLPKDMRKLVNLKEMYLYECEKLTYMPVGMDTLTCLHRLTMFIVCDTNSSKTQTGGLEDLKALVNLRDDLCIKVREFNTEDQSKVEEERYLLGKSHLKRLSIKFTDSNVKEDVEEALLKGLQPNRNLKSMKLVDYKGMWFPQWAMINNLVSISLYNLHRVQHLPSLSRLPYLKGLYLKGITNLEFMEEDNLNDKDGDIEYAFFPSLNFLGLDDMPKLKGWWRIERGDAGSPTDDGIGSSGEQVVANSNSRYVLLFHHLSILNIHRCPNLIWLPPCPKLQELMLVKANQELSLGLKTTSISRGMSVLRRLCIDEVGGYKNCLLEESTRGLNHLIIQDSKEESLSTAEMLFQRCAPSLRILDISTCQNLKSIVALELEHLTNLKTLYISYCKNLALQENEHDDDDGLRPWKSLVHLSACCFSCLPKLVNLPKGIQYCTTLHTFSIYQCENLTCLPEWLSCLTSLQFLEIWDCRNLKSLPEAMRHLPSLAKLQIVECDALTERCRGPNGEDWPKISHIPSLIVMDKDDED